MALGSKRSVRQAPSSLTERQRRFVEEYCVDFKALPAAWRAGFSKDDRAAGARLLRDPAVLKEINARVLAISARLDCDAEDIRAGFCRIAWDPRPPPEGPTHGERITALRELGRLMGLYSERHIFVGVTLEQLLSAVDNPNLLPTLQAGGVTALLAPTSAPANGESSPTAS